MIRTLSASVTVVAVVDETSVADVRVAVVSVDSVDEVCVVVVVVLNSGTETIVNVNREFQSLDPVGAENTVTELLVSKPYVAASMSN